jgi:hypothetical protein
MWHARPAGQAVKGDRVEIVIDAGGTSRTYEVTATRAGRRVDVVTRRGVVEVMEVTRGGSAVRTARFMASRVIALVEHPAGRIGTVEQAADRSGPAARRRAGTAGAARTAAAAQPTAAAEPTGTTEPAGAAQPSGATEPSSMVEDAVDRTASQLD